MLRLWWLAFIGEARRRPLKTAAQLVAIAAGVALAFGIHLINQAALAEFSAALREINGEPDAVVTGPREGFDETLFFRLATDPAVRTASPVLETEVMAVGADGATRRLSVLGIDALRAPRLAPALRPVPGPPAVRSGDVADGSPGASDAQEEASRFALFGEGLYVAPGALARLGLAVGDAVELGVGAASLQLEVAGTLPGATDSARLAVMDLGQAQWKFDRLGRLTRIDLDLAPGVTPASLAAGLELPPGVRIENPGSDLARLSNLSRAYRVNLTVLAMVALFTGAFLVFSLQAQSVLGRRAQFAFLRAAGLTGTQLGRLLLAEAAVVGVVGSAAGLVAGAALAGAALRLLGADLGAGFFGEAGAVLRIGAGETLAYGALGITAALAGTLAPAREAARVNPARALHAGGEEDALKPLGRAWPGLLLLAAGALLAALPPWRGIPVAAYLAVGVLLGGTILLQPRYASRLFTPLASAVDRAGSARAPLLLLASRRLAATPGLASIGMAAIVASFALMVAMATMVTSFRGSVDDWLGRVLPADLYARAGQTGADTWFSERDLARLAGHAGVERAEFSRLRPVRLDPDRPPVVLIARPVPADRPEEVLPMTGRAAPWREALPPPAWVSEAMVELYGARPGGMIELPVDGDTLRFHVAGVWRDYARQFGSVVVRDEDYLRLTGDRRRNDAALWLRPGAGAARVAAELRPRLDAASATEFSEPAALRALSLAIFDRSFAVTYVLEAAAVVIGLAGIAATFSAQALARRREFGLLRHLGLTRGQVLRLMAIEGALVTASAALAGLAAGLVVSLVLVHVITPASFYWTMDFAVPARLILALVAALLASAAVAAAVAARGALAPGALYAVHDDH